MKYFLDTEFHEYKKKPLFGKAVDTIELISIGIVAEDGREFYAISKEFDVKAAWKNNWLRENVLMNIYNEKVHGDMRNVSTFSYRSIKAIIKGFGKSNKQIAEDIKDFVSRKDISDRKNKVYNDIIMDTMYGKNTREAWSSYEERMIILESHNDLPEFYGYYSDYDWIVFCWLFGRMIDLPKGFPMYCLDLKQSLDEVAAKVNSLYFRIVSLDEESGSIPSELIETNVTGWDLGKKLQLLKHQQDYPKQTNEHNALVDAKWNYELYKFLQRL